MLSAMEVELKQRQELEEEFEAEVAQSSLQSKLTQVNQPIPQRAVAESLCVWWRGHFSPEAAALYSNWIVVVRKTLFPHFFNECECNDIVTITLFHYLCLSTLLTQLFHTLAQFSLSVHDCFWSQCCQKSYYNSPNPGWRRGLGSRGGARFGGVGRKAQRPENWIEKIGTNPCRHADEYSI